MDLYLHKMRLKNLLKNVKTLKMKRHIKHSFYDLEIDKYYKFSSGPFTDKIFQNNRITKK